MEYNLLATTEQLTISEASSELWMNLRAIGDSEAKVDRSRIKGLILGWTSLGAVEAINSLRDYLEEEPEKFKYIYRIMPILTWVNTGLDDIVREVNVQKEKIGKGDTFRVTVEKRRTDLRRLEIIEPVADAFDNDVDLENPDWIVLINVLGGKTGVSIIEPRDKLNVQKEKYELSKKDH